MMRNLKIGIHEQWVTFDNIDDQHPFVQDYLQQIPFQVLDLLTLNVKTFNELLWNFKNGNPKLFIVVF